MHGPLNVKFYPFFDFGASWGGWSTPFPDCFTPGKDKASSAKGNKPYMYLTFGIGVLHLNFSTPVCKM